MTATTRPAKLRVCAVSYLNTVPLVWGMLHGGAGQELDLMFRLPAECADLLASGQADIGIVPCYELLRQPLETVPGVGIAARAAVRSILLISRVPAVEIRTLAADSSSRTSVALARIILEQRYGARPAVISRPPDLASMLAQADAALIIGDPALRLDPAALPYRVWDLGLEWFELTGLPMVFAVWAGRAECITPAVTRLFQDSCAAGLRSIDEIVRIESAARGFPPELVRRYFTDHVVLQLGDAEYRGLQRFLSYARALPQFRGQAT